MNKILKHLITFLCTVILSGTSFAAANQYGAITFKNTGEKGVHETFSLLVQAPEAHLRHYFKDMKFSDSVTIPAARLPRANYIDIYLEGSKHKGICLSKVLTNPDMRPRIVYARIKGDKIECRIVGL